MTRLDILIDEQVTLAAAGEIGAGDRDSIIDALIEARGQAAELGLEIIIDFEAARFVDGIDPARLIGELAGRCATERVALSALLTRALRSSTEPPTPGWLPHFEPSIGAGGYGFGAVHW